MVARAAVAAVLGLLAVLAGPSGVAAQTSQQAAQAAGSSGVSQKCIDAGLALSSACSTEINGLLKSLGVSSADGGNIGALVTAANTALSAGKVDTLLAEFSPSVKCCSAACAFTANLCGCDQKVLDLVRSVINVDAATANKVLSAFASKCKFENLSITAGTCPAANAPTPAIKCPE